MSAQTRLSLRRTRCIRFLAGLVFLFGGFSISSKAATLCVNPGGTSGCQSTISAAVAAASAGDTINVAPGTYKEMVTISKPLSLVGAGPYATTIDASGLANGIYIDGYDNPGLSHVTVTGFAVENANFEGILVQNASFVTVWGNHVQQNDLSLNSSLAVCPGLPAFETNEPDDCGEGIHLMGADHSTIAANLIEQNAGGILVTDETAANHDNVITRNTVRNNSYDCGITLASHAPYPGTVPAPFGVYHNTISENDSIHNGFGVGGGAGVGLFAPAPGNKTYANSVVHNRLLDNALPGVAIHNHAPVPPPIGPNVNDNVITGNFISGNGPDPDVPTSMNTGISVLGASAISGLVISGNVIENEQIDVAVNNAKLPPSTASSVDLHLNDLSDGTIGVQNLNPAGSVIDATENWWGCPAGPGAKGCSSVSGGVTFAPWLTQPVFRFDADRDRGEGRGRDWR